ncbi:hypothetical protein BpHYR1_033401 [Brachionus plicatilis]|uniref:Uncharacterized protein n=1 Tax=Brachionus plicatilis TaxID=10195 RepID=A0A3M7Q2K6_BRAPC|nr:hypothetical protein BpHYR1_033401 [Brachionus plicatilis]
MLGASYSNPAMNGWSKSIVIELPNARTLDSLLLQRIDDCSWWLTGGEPRVLYIWLFLQPNLIFLISLPVKTVKN